MRESSHHAALASEDEFDLLYYVRNTRQWFHWDGVPANAHAQLTYRRPCRGIKT